MKLTLKYRVTVEIIFAFLLRII